MSYTYSGYITGEKLEELTTYLNNFKISIQPSHTSFSDQLYLIYQKLAHFVGSGISGCSLKFCANSWQTEYTLRWPKIGKGTECQGFRGHRG